MVEGIINFIIRNDALVVDNLNRPHNPLIKAGCIMACSMIKSNKKGMNPMNPSEKFK